MQRVYYAAYRIQSRRIYNGCLHVGELESQDLLIPKSWKPQNSSYQGCSTTLRGKIWWLPGELLL